MSLTVCTFKLNGKPMSSFELGGTQYPAFSGMGEDKNKKQTVCLKSVGNKGDWLALYADDGSVDDQTLCDQTSEGISDFTRKALSGEVKVVSQSNR